MDNKMLKSALNGFEDLILRGGLDRIYKSFLNDCEMLTGRTLDNGIIAFHYNEQDEYGLYQNRTYKLSDKLMPILRETYYNAIEGISNQVDVISEDESKKSSLRTFINALMYYHIVMMESNHLQQSNLIDNFIFKVLKYIREKYSYLDLDVNVNNAIEDTFESNTDGFFGFKAGTKDVQRLYEALVRLKFFSEETPFDDFKNIIYTDNPQTLSNKISLGCSLKEAAFIIASLHPLFHKWNDKTFTASKAFVIKGTEGIKNINYGSLQSQRSKFINDPRNEEKIRAINDEIEKLKR
ncbi:MAG: hypothetical protein ACTHMD_10925 [Flavisolibacter sp.]